MASPRVLVLRAPGTNCDLETEHAFGIAGASPERMHVNRLLEQPTQLGGFQILCLPGGFSYGDDLAAGRILATQLKARLLEPIREFKSNGKLILGICNGFQILMKSGLLDDEGSDPAGATTLTWNDTGRFIDRWVNLEVAPSPCVFFRGIERMYLPIAHAEGKFAASSPRVLERLESAGRIALRYRDDDNPNGSIGNVAGVCDASGRVCGLMPHPERHVTFTQHPRWTREPRRVAGDGDGLRVFQNAVDYFR